MAQLFNGIDDAPLREAISHIEWTLHGEVFSGLCADDGLFKAVIPFTGGIDGFNYPNDGSFDYSCAKVKTQISWSRHRDPYTKEPLILLQLNLAKALCNDPIYDYFYISPQRELITRLKWSLRGEVMRAQSPDDRLFRGVVPDAAPDERGIYPSQGCYLHQYEALNKSITWFKNDDLKTDEAAIEWILPLYDDRSDLPNLLTNKQLKAFKTEFDRFLFNNFYHPSKDKIDRYLERFHYDLFEKYQLSTEQGEQILDYLASIYK